MDMPSADDIKALEKQIEELVHEVWREVIQVCTRTLHIADFYGFDLMHIPDPDVPAMVKLLDNLVVPYIEILVKSPHIPAESNIQIINMKQYILHLREISIALGSSDRIGFESAVARLRQEAMLLG